MILCFFLALPPQASLWNLSIPLKKDIDDQSALHLNYDALFNDIYRPLGYSTCANRHGAGWLFLHKKHDCRDAFRVIFEKFNVSRPEHPPSWTDAEKQKNNYLLCSNTDHCYAHLKHQYISKRKADNPSPIFDQELLNMYIERAMRKEPMGYGHESLFLYAAISDFPVGGQVGAVFGTVNPWVEGILLASKASSVITVEYRPIVTTAKNLVTLTTEDWVTSMYSGNYTQVDFAVSFSSFEHDGLGRYGDPLDPFGDIKIMQALTCYVKEGGLLYLAFPINSVDSLFWNAHRVYGPARLPLMTANWELLKAYYGFLHNGFFSKGLYRTPKVPGFDANTFQGFWGSMAMLSPNDHSQPVIVLRNAKRQPCL